MPKPKAPDKPAGPKIPRDAINRESGEVAVEAAIQIESIANALTAYVRDCDLVERGQLQALSMRARDLAGVVIQACGDPFYDSHSVAPL